MQSSVRNITITKNNYFKVKCFEKEFKDKNKYLEYEKLVKKFKNNTKFLFEFKCFNCELNISTYHWTIKCIECGFRQDVLNSFIRSQELFLTGYWDPKNIIKRFKNKSIYL